MGQASSTFNPSPPTDGGDQTPLSQATTSAGRAIEGAHRGSISQPKPNLLERVRYQAVARWKQRDNGKNQDSFTTMTSRTEGNEQISGLEVPASKAKSIGHTRERIYRWMGAGRSALPQEVDAEMRFSAGDDQTEPVRSSDALVGDREMGGSYMTSSQTSLQPNSAQNYIHSGYTPPPIYSPLAEDVQQQSSISDSEYTAEGETLLYKESFEIDSWPKSGFWESLPRWAQSIGFYVTESHTESPQSVSLNLPTEILLLICDRALEGTEGGDKRAREYRKNVMGITLTCRAWATKRHQFLYANVERNGPVEGGESPAYVSLVAQFSRNWALNDWREDSPPGWVRRYLSLYIPARNRAFECEHMVKLKLTINLGIRAQHNYTKCRSIFSFCPKPLPPSSLPTIRELRLRNHRFQCFSDLMHAIWELPMLELLYCDTISWEGFQILPLPTLRAHRTDRFRIHAYSCPDAAPFALLATSLFKVQTEGMSGILQSSDALSLVQATRLLVPPNGEYVIERNGCSYNAHSTSNHDVNNPEMQLIRTLQFELRPDPENGPKTLCSSNLKLTLDLDIVRQYIQRIKWTALGDCLQSLLRGTDEALTISFLHNRRPSRRLCSESAAYVISNLRTMWDQGHLRFQKGKGDWYGHIGEWRHLSELEELVIDKVHMTQLASKFNGGANNQDRNQRVR